MGLQFSGGVFRYGPFIDGYLEAESEIRRWDPREDWGTQCKVFASRAEFVAWLADQTDDTLAGKTLMGSLLRGNQRLTVDRLKAFVQVASL